MLARSQNNLETWQTYLAEEFIYAAVTQSSPIKSPTFCIKNHREISNFTPAPFFGRCQRVSHETMVPKKITVIFPKKTHHQTRYLSAALGSI